MGLPPPAPRPPGEPRPAKRAVPPEAAPIDAAPFEGPRDGGEGKRTRDGHAPTAAGRETAAERAERAQVRSAAQEHVLRRTRRRNVVFLILFGGMAYLLGWYARYYGTIPGVFLASDVGVPAVLLLALAGVARIMRRGISQAAQARPAAALARGGAWALGAFWAIWTVTTVPQLAVGLAAAILAFALFWSRDRLARAGHAGFGPSFGPTLLLISAYPLWVGARELLGAVPYFDLASAAGAFVFALAVEHRALRAAREAELRLSDPRIAARARHDAARSGRSTRVVLFLIVGYLVFTFFISPAIPYGPIVEWFIVAMAPLLFVLVVASRIGTVPTRQALPPVDVRSHEQRVYSLPDHHLAEVEARLAAYVHHNRDREWLSDYALRLMVQSGVPRGRREPVLERLTARRTGEAERRAALEELRGVLDSVLPESGARVTDILKTNRPVASSETGWIRVPG